MVRVAVLISVLAVAAVAVAVALAATRSPRALRAAIFASARKQHSAHYVEHGVAQGLHQTMVADVAATRGIQRVSFTLGGKKGQFTVRVVGRTAYLLGNTVALDSFLGFTAAQAAQYHGRWISVTPSSQMYKALAASVTLPSFLHDIYPSAPLAFVTAKIGGRKVTGVRGTTREPGVVRFVEAVYPDSKLRPFGVADIESSKAFIDEIRISRWNEPVHVQAPANAVPIATVQA
ncbi:MAG TPA: hypothetical protein VGP54_00345 [Gaiellaceae bacterium]|jgi:hypothetical protein|nr:hypothetical protein [Gaiellaceae bacterium]